MVTQNELFCYRHKEDTDHRVMHSLLGIFPSKIPKESSQSENCDLFPVKILIPPNKRRVLYFKSEEQQDKLFSCLTDIAGF